MAEYINNSELARRLKTVGESAVRRAKGDGKLDGCLSPDGKKINWQKAQKNAWVIANQVVKPKAGVSRAKALEKLKKATPTPKEGRKKAGEFISKILKNAEIPPKNAGNIPHQTDIDELSNEDLLSSVKIYKSTSLQDAMRLREVFGAALDQRKLEELEGTLIKRDVVQKSLFVFGNLLKKAIMTLPERVVDNVRAAPNKVEALNIMKMEINSLLSLYADEKNWTIKNAEN